MNFEQTLNLRIGALAETGIAGVMNLLLVVAVLVVLGIAGYQRGGQAKAVVSSFVVLSLLVGGLFIGTPKSDAATVDGQDHSVTIELERNSEATFDSVVFVGDDDVKDGTVGAHPNGYTLYARTQGIDLSQVTLSINGVTLGDDAVNIHQTGDGNTDINYVTHIKAVSSANAYLISGKIIYTVVENTADQSAYYNQSVNWQTCYNSSDPDDQAVVHEQDSLLIQKISDDDGLPEYDELTGEPIMIASPLVDDYTNYDCAKISAPTNYYDQSTSSITLALARYNHKGADADKLGSIIMNPGGPGGQGVGTMIADGRGKQFADGTFAPAFTGVGTVALTNYDIASFDPRGTGRSTQLICDPTGLATGDYATVIASCYDNTPNKELLSFMDTVTQAHDLDLVRSVLGDTKLNYIGMSWGSMLGAAYTGEFPDKIGHVLLDGIVPFEDGHSILGHMINHARVNEYNNIVNDVLTQCASVFVAICPFDGSNLTANRAQLNDLFAETTEYDPSGALTQQLFSVIASAFNDKLMSTLIGQLGMLQSIVEPSGGLSLSAPKSLSNLLPIDIPDTSFSFNTVFTSCLDEQITDAEVAENQNYAMQTFSDVNAIANIAVSFFGEPNICSGLPLRTTPNPNYNNIDLPTIILSHSAFDFNTPPELSQRVKQQTPNSVMVEYLGSGHCSYAFSAELTRDVNIFFNTDVKPVDGTQYPRHLQIPPFGLSAPASILGQADQATDSPESDLPNSSDDVPSVDDFQDEVHDLSAE